jgi:hypothetical protein
MQSAEEVVDSWTEPPNRRDARRAETEASAVEEARSQTSRAGVTVLICHFFSIEGSELCHPTASSGWVLMAPCATNVIFLSEVRRESPKSRCGSTNRPCCTPCQHQPSADHPQRVRCDGVGWSIFKPIMIVPVCRSPYYVVSYHLPLVPAPFSHNRWAGPQLLYLHHRLCALINLSS